MDRDYWRSEPTKRLIEESRTKGCELCRAIGERLEDAEHELNIKIGDVIDEREEAYREANKLDDRVYELGVEIDKLELMLAQREDRIAELEAQLKKGK